MSNLRLSPGIPPRHGLTSANPEPKAIQSIRFSGPGGTQPGLTYGKKKKRKSNQVALHISKGPFGVFTQPTTCVRLVVREATYLANGTPDKLLILWCFAPRHPTRTPTSMGPPDIRVLPIDSFDAVSGPSVPLRQRCPVSTLPCLRDRDRAWSQYCRQCVHREWGIQH